jgi:hypothetical protein
VCRRCRKLLGHIEHGELSWTWRCDRCSGNYPFTLERMRVEYAAAIERGDHAIELPLV